MGLLACAALGAPAAHGYLEGDTLSASDAQVRAHGGSCKGRGEFSVRLWGRESRVPARFGALLGSG